LNPDDPPILAHLGLLGLCRLIGSDAAYAHIGAASPPGPATIEDGAARLALTRLAAGNQPDSPTAQFDHAIAALLTGHHEEADLAIKRFADSAPSWDRRARAQTLNDLATTHPDLSEPIRALQQTLLNVDDRPR